jgi:hypothetical protein
VAKVSYSTKFRFFGDFSHHFVKQKEKGTLEPFWFYVAGDVSL